MNKPLQLSQTIRNQVNDPTLLIKIETTLENQVNDQIPSIRRQEHIESRVRWPLEDMMEPVAQTIINELNPPGMPPVVVHPWVLMGSID